MIEHIGRRRRMRTVAMRSAIGILLLVQGRAALAGREPAAETAARRTLDAMGGADAFARLRTLRFDFVVLKQGTEAGRWAHVWDRHDGRYRLEGARGGKKLVVLFNVNDHGTPSAGAFRAWSEGVEVRDEAERTKLAEFAYDRFINDTYWLLMPAKMLDSGVNLASDGEATEGGRSFDRVRLTFDKVGLTPGDTYRAWIARDSGLMEKWDFVLEGQKESDRATFLWQEWKPVGPVRLSSLKKTPDGAFGIRFDNLSGSTVAEDAAFAPPR